MNSYVAKGFYNKENKSLTIKFYNPITKTTQKFDNIPFNLEACPIEDRIHHILSPFKFDAKNNILIMHEERKLLEGIMLIKKNKYNTKILVIENGDLLIHCVNEESKYTQELILPNDLIHHVIKYNSKDVAGDTMKALALHLVLKEPGILEFDEVKMDKIHKENLKLMKQKNAAKIQREYISWKTSQLNDLIGLENNMEVVMLQGTYNETGEFTLVKILLNKDDNDSITIKAGERIILHKLSDFFNKKEINEYINDKRKLKAKLRENLSKLIS